MKTANFMQFYTEPHTEVCDVISDGFICQSILTICLSTDVDELVNKESEVLISDND